MEKAKLALLAAVIDPEVGGVLLVGDKGTGKTTLVRSLAQVLSEIPVIKGCPFNCNPFNPREMCDKHYKMWLRGERFEVEWRPMRVIDLPLNISVDRLVGSIDVDAALKRGEVVFKPGLLAEANRNILYIDEVNLLDDHIADLILDAAATGWNVVEREGFSIRHPARFILVGSMNPEEGELRPQLLDRFGLYVDVNASQDPEERALIVERVEEFRRDPIGFMKRYEKQEAELRQRIRRARELLPRVEIPRSLLRLITETTVKLGIRTHRADIVTARTAKALAALDGRTTVSIEDVKKAMELALPHRLRSQPFESPEEKMKKLQTLLQNLGRDGQQDTGRQKNRPENGRKNPLINNRSMNNGSKGGERVQGGREDGGEDYSGKPTTGSIGSGAGSGATPLARLGDVRADPWFHEPPRSIYYLPEHAAIAPTGPRGRVRWQRYRVSFYGWGRHVDSIPFLREPERLGEGYQVDYYATLRAALRRRARRPSVHDIHVRVYREEPEVLHMILLDASGSMYAERRLVLAKSIAEGVTRRSYVERTWVGLIAFQGRNAQTLVKPTRNWKKLMEALNQVTIGGSTPLPAALLEASRQAKGFLLKRPNAHLVLHIITDGRANVPLTNSIESDIIRVSQELRRLKVKAIVYDTKSTRSLKLLDYTELLAKALGAEVVKIPYRMPGIDA